MSYVEVETGRYVKRWAFWNPATWSIPKLYWDAWSQEQRLHAICRQLEKVIKYADYLGVNVDDIAARLKAIEEGQLDPLIEAAIEAWFEDNEPAIVAAIEALNDALPIGDFNAENTVKDAIDAEASARQTAVAELPTVYETVADMVANAGTETYAKTLGYHVIGTGSADYIISDTAMGVSIPLDSGKYAILVYDEHCLYPEMFGAYGDGTHDDTAAIQQTVDSAASGAKIIFNARSYKTTDTIDVQTDYLSFNGNGFYYNTQIESTASPVMRVSNSGANFYKVQFINSNGAAGASTNTCVKFDIIDHNDAVFDNCQFTGFFYCVECYGRNITIKQSTFTWCFVAMHVLYNVQSQQTVGMIIDSCHFHTCLDDSNASTITWNSLRAWVMDIESTVPMRGVHITNNEFSGGSFIGFYRGPSGAKIENNSGANQLGGAVGHVYINAYQSGNVTYYSNNTITNMAALGVNNVRDFLATKLIYGWIIRSVVNGNVFSIRECKTLIENMGGASEGQNYGIFMFNGNVVNKFANGTDGVLFKYNAATGAGGNVIMGSGNMIRSGASPTPQFTDNAGIYNKTSWNTWNWIEQFTMP